MSEYVTYSEWVAGGQKWSPALPIAEIATALAKIPGSAGTIGTIGNQAHLTANPPEDHCPYSHTGWPIKSPYPYVHAVDYSGPHWETIRDYWISEARAGRFHAAKYINTGTGWEYSHTDGFKSPVRNSDTGHVHLSIRSDFTHTSIGGWRPVPDLSEEVDVKLPTLTHGAKGQYVKNMQGLLVAHGHNIAVDGEFGPDTEKALGSKTCDTATWTKLLGS